MKLLRLVKDYGELREDEWFFPDSCTIERGGYEYMRLVRFPDGKRVSIRHERYVELFEMVDNLTIVGDDVYEESQEPTGLGMGLGATRG